MRCPNCAGSVEERVRRCRHCGADLHRIASATTMEGPPIAVGETLQFPPGKVFARRFTIVEQIGRGGMGVVYKALDGDLGQTVALKLILPKFAAVPAFTQRFRREVRLARQISHPNVCRVFDLGEEEGVLYLSMEWIDGETLGKLLRQAGRLGETRALEIAEKISGALEAAHARGISLRIRPRAYRSARPSTDSPRACSGGM